MCLNYKLFPLVGGILLLSGCSAGFLGLAPAGDRHDYTSARNAYSAGNYTQAISELSGYIYKTKNVKRREARAYRLLGQSYERLGDLSKALEVYLEALEFHPKNVPLLLAAAGLYQRTGLTDRSMELYERALKQEPHNEEALAGQAANYSKTGFYSKARAFYDQFFDLNPTAGPQYRARYADTFLRQRNYQDAFIHITMALAENDQSPDFWLLSAQALRGLGNFSEALVNLDTALSLAPTRTDLLAHKALWQYQAGHFQKALETARLLLAITPHNQLGEFIEAISLYELGQHKQALAQLAHSQDCNPESFVGKVAAALLKENK